MHHAALAPKTFRRVADFVALHARRRPGHPAIIRDGTPITYGALALDLFAVIAALQKFNLRPGAIAAIAHEDLYIHLLLVFGCEALGITTGSFRPQEGPEVQSLLDLADFVLTSQPRAGANPASKTFAITADWLAATLAAPPMAMPPFTPAAPTDAELILRSSGTTGTPKAMSVTHAGMRDRRARQRDQATGLGLNREARYLALMHFAVGSTYMAASNLLRLGATFIFQSAIRTAPYAPTDKLLAAARPTHLTLMPFQLRALLATLPPRAVPLLPGLTVQSVGAKLPPELRQATLQKLAGCVKDNYGANEAGAVASVDETGTLHILPGVEIEIAGPDGARLPPGELGAIRIRTPSMVTFYLNDDAATATTFRPAQGHSRHRQSWFYPGDLGILSAKGRLTLAGRRNDVLNLGGIKVAAPDIEAKIIAQTNLRDVALLQRDHTPHQTGPSPVIVCAVLRDGAAPTQKQLESIISPILSYPFRIFLLDSIPRTPEGKIQRARLHDKFFPPTQSAA